MGYLATTGVGRYHRVIITGRRCFVAHTVEACTTFRDLRHWIGNWSLRILIVAVAVAVAESRYHRRGSGSWMWFECARADCVVCCNQVAVLFT